MLKIMIVDDNQDDREGLRDFIDWHELGFCTPILAENGLSGFQMAITEEPDVIISDVAMPHMNGLVMIESLINKGIQPKVIFISCFDEFEYVRKAIELHSFNYILKPIELDKLEYVLKSVVEEISLRKARQKMLEELSLKAQFHMSVFREKLIRDIYYGLIDHEEMGDEAEQIGLDTDKECYVALCVSLINFNQLFCDLNSSQRLIIMRNVQKHIKDAFPNTIQILLEQWQGCLLLQLCLEKSDQQDLQERLLSGAAIIREELAKQMGVTASIGLSGITFDIRQTGILAASTKHITISDLYSNKSGIILDEGFAGRQYPVRINPALLKEILVKSFDIPADDVTKQLLELVGTNQNGEVYRLAAYSLYDIIRQENRGDTVTVDYLVSITEVEDVESFRHWIFNLLSHQKSVLKERNNRTSAIADDLERIIRKGYSTISKVEQIVESVFVSASYGNAVFRKARGMTLYDYLMAVRLEKAKELLQNPYVKVYEVAREIGYVSTAYFSTMFKEQTGMTPKHYANQFFMPNQKDIRNENK